MLRTARPRFVGLFLAASVLLAACGGGGGGGASAPSPAAPAPSPGSPAATLPDLPNSGTAMVVLSEAGDPIGGGKGSFVYNQATAGISVTRTGALLTVTVRGDETWVGSFVSPAGDAPLEVGTYADLSDSPSGSSSNGWQAWGPEVLLRNCPQPRGSLNVTEVAYRGTQLAFVELEFEQRCAGAAGSLRGRLRWDSSDPTQPPGPAETAAELWRAPVGAVPASGNYVHLEGGTARTQAIGPVLTYTPDNALIGLSAAGRRLTFRVQGDLEWLGHFHAMSSRDRIEVGYYPLLLDMFRNNPAKGALSWFQPTFSHCLSGSRAWVAVDVADYIGDRLQRLEMRFEQGCGAASSAPPVRGQIRWSADDRRLPPGPQPVPAGLWQPGSGSLPTNGSYVFLDSEPGDWIGGGMPLTLTPADHDFVVYESDGRIEMRIGGIGGWSGTFKGPAGWGRPQAGYYGQLLHASSGNPARGGLNWSSPGRGCDAQGWFVIDSVTYSHRVLHSLDLRFEQGCAASGPRLRGKVHWVSPDPVTTLGPVDAVTPPSTPPPLVVPGSGSYLVLDSGEDDFIGGGAAYVYTKADADMRLVFRNGGLDVQIRGDEQWFGRLAPPPGQTIGTSASFNSVARVAAGPDVAGLDWNGEGRGCNEVTKGSWSVENLRVSGEQVLAADLRFEQYCDGLLTPLRGVLHWEQGDTTVPPGPVLPPPATLWRLPDALVPAAGNYMYLHSPAGAFIGNGQNRLFTSTDTTFAISSTGATLAFGASLDLTLHHAGERWDLELSSIMGMSQVAPGYYGIVKRDIVHNPTRGGLDFGGASRACNEIYGWFVVDGISYDGPAVAALAMRFEIFCEGSTPPIHGQLRWSR